MDAAGIEAKKGDDEAANAAAIEAEVLFGDEAANAAAIKAEDGDEPVIVAAIEASDEPANAAAIEAEVLFGDEAANAAAIKAEDGDEPVSAAAIEASDEAANAAVNAAAIEAKKLSEAANAAAIETKELFGDEVVNAAANAAAIEALSGNVAEAEEECYGNPIEAGVKKCCNNELNSLPAGAKESDVENPPGYCVKCKTGCMKGYCPCFRAGRRCNERCTCVLCGNGHPRGPHQ